MTRVVITGLGAATAIGLDVKSFWSNLLLGVSGVGPVTGIDRSDLPYEYAAEIHSPLPGVSPPPGPRTGRATGLITVVVREALAQSGLTPQSDDPVGLAVGTTLGDIGAMEADLLAGKSAAAVDPSAITNRVAEEFGLLGPRWTITNACAAGNYAIARCYDDLKAGRVQVAVAGGVDVLSWVAFAGFSSLRAMARQRCQPFDRNREGLILGEGAAALVLETEEHALQRGAPILAEVLGYGLSCDAHHLTQPDSAGMARAMRQALESTGVSPDEIDYISAHGTGTPNNDRAEAQATYSIFGSRVPISSIKAQIGHTLGAASALEAVVCTKVLLEGILPATRNVTEQDPACPLDVVPNKPRGRRVRKLLSNAYAFGGNNSSLLLSVWQGPHRAEGGQPS